MKKKNNYFVILFCAVFLIVGIVFLAVGITVMVTTNHFRKNAVEITAEITKLAVYRDSDGDRKHRAYVTYQYGDTVFEDIGLNFYRSNMYEGEKIPLLCDPDNPGHVMSSSGMILLEAVFIGIGAIFSSIALIFIGTVKRKASQKKKLVSSGRRLSATVEQITRNTSLKMNGQSPYQIYCYYRDDYKDVVYRFKSENLWTNPNLMIQPGDSIYVYVDEKNYCHYHVDTESILNKKIADYT